MQGLGFVNRIKRHQCLAASSEVQQAGAALEHVDLGGGAKQIIFLALTATLDPGSEVIVPAPYWVSYPDMVAGNEGTPIVVTCSEHQQFKLTAQQLDAAITPRTRWLILNTPSNPTGVAYTADELRAIAAVLARHPNVGLLTDGRRVVQQIRT